MKLKTVTITGADNNTDCNTLFELSKQYPFVEWGILFSPKREGTARYPSSDWVSKFYSKSKELKLDINCSAHLCGEYSVQKITEGRTLKYLSKVGHAALLFNRCQLNFNSVNTPVKYDALASSLKCWTNKFILQYNKSNTEICQKIINDKSIPNNRIHFLYDGSGGRGVTPAEWKEPVQNHFTGYAGGLSPDNIHDELIKIQSVSGKSEIWVDTETGVRTDEKLDLNKVVKFLDVCSTFIKK